MADDTVPATTPTKGYRTSEMWLTIAAFVLSALYASGAFADTSTTGKALALLAGVLSAMGYTVSRSIVKAKA